MSKKWNICDIVLELLPLYIEKKTGEESNFLLENHLTECQECQNVYQLMSADFTESIKGNENNRKKSRKKMSSRNKKIIFLISALVGYVLLMAGIVIGTFLYLIGI